MKQNWENYGDVSPQHGQTWLGSGGGDYCEIVEVLCGSDVGLADNQYMISRGSVYFSPQNWDSAMSCCDSGIYGPPTFHDIAYAFNAYQGFDQDIYGGIEVIQVGKHAESEVFDKPDIVLHGNASIERYIERHWLN